MNGYELPQPPPDGTEIRLALLAEPSSVVLARELVRYALTNWGYDNDLIHDSMLVMSEIVTNAVHAARSREIRLRCAIHRRSPLLECWDPAPALPTSREIPETAESGRGLTIIAAYSKECGTHRSPTGDGKVVWAAMPVP